jgi:uncharacterized membrane protein YfcA
LDHNSFASSLIAYALGKLLWHFLPNFAATLLASVLGASIGAALNRPPRAA